MFVTECDVALDGLLQRVRASVCATLELSPGKN